FYPIEPLPRLFRIIGYANPITWHVDVLRYATIGLGEPRAILLESIAFLTFGAVAFGFALRALRNQE
ncbi:MAG: ABC transporter permease, partial [Chthoniobacterales bacterium]|nr:ABC transporter permease [Chthoniobacterales bacterium]